MKLVIQVFIDIFRQSFHQGNSPKTQKCHDQRPTSPSSATGTISILLFIAHQTTQFEFFHWRFLIDFLLIFHCFFLKIRKNKRDEVMDKKRSLGGTSFAPFLIALIPLNEQIDPQSALNILKTCDPDAIASTSPTGVTHITYVFE